MAKDKVGAELDQLVAEIGNYNQGDSVTAQLAKGVADGLRDSLALLKAAMGKAQHEEPDGDEGEEPDGDEGEEPDGDEGQPDAGYNDMGKGAEGDDFIDATELVADLTRRSLANDEMLKAMRSEIAGLKRLIAQSQAAQAAVLAPLAKGVVQMHEALARQPAAVGAFGGIPVNADRARARHGVQPPAGAQLDPVALAKAMQRGVITEDQLAAYKRSGKFAADDASHAAIVAKVQAV